MLQDVIDALRRNSPEAVALGLAEAAAAPESADAQHLLGMAQRDAGDHVVARASFERAIALAPDESLYHFSHALLAYSAGDVSAANRSSAHAIALDPNQLGAYLLRIQLAMASSDLAEAERQLNLAERVNPEHPQLFFAAGQVALAKGDGDHGIELLNRAAVERPDDVQILATLAVAYQRFGHPAFAEQAVRKAMTLEPAATGLRRVLVESLIAQGRIDDAQTELAAYQHDNPRDPMGPLIAAELRLRANEPAPALAAFRSALVLAPRNPRALIGVEQALATLSDRTLARAVWDDILKQDPGFDLTWLSRLVVVDDPDDHVDVLRRWRMALPDSPSMLVNQARLDEGSGRDAEAEAGYDAVLARLPQQADALFGKAIYELRRDPSAAIARLGDAISQAPEAQARPALAVRGQLNDGLDHLDAAIADWRQAYRAPGSRPVAQPLPPKEVALQALASLPVDSDPGDNQVVMLWGPPGSGSERLAAALRFSPSRPLLQDAPEPRPRLLEFPDLLISRALDAELMPGLAHEVAADFARTIDPYLRQGNQGVFDWLARWDARVVPMLRHALPHTRLVAVLRDPRDMLLNWLAFGAPAGPVFSDPGASASWLANQLEHLLFSRDVLQLPVFIVDMDHLDADPDGTMQEIARFADLPTAPDAQVVRARAIGRGGLPTMLPSGRWRAYRERLADAFALLESLAGRLGYPRD